MLIMLGHCWPEDGAEVYGKSSGMGYYMKCCLNLSTVRIFIGELKLRIALALKKNPKDSCK